MKNYKNLTESDFQRLTKLILESEKDVEELDEILGATKLGDLYQGVRGFMKGESFGYYKYLSKIKNRGQKVVKELDDIEKFMTELNDLKPRLEKLTIAPEKKMRLLRLLDFAVSKYEGFYPEYKKAVAEISRIADEKLTGQRLDVIPGSKRTQIGKDLLVSKDKTETDLNKPEEIDVEATTTTTTTKKPSGFSSGSIPKKPELTKADDPLQEEVSRFKQLIK
jgi:hypothetical protein